MTIETASEQVTRTLTPERKYTTISIPTPLYQQVAAVIEGTDFRSVTEFLVYITRERLAAEQATARRGIEPPA